MPRRSHESLGDYISSACFGGVAFLSLLNGLEAFYSGNILRAISIWFVCFLLCLAVFRYAIARLFDSIADKNAADADAFLKKNGIIVRRMAGYGLPECLRITIGTEREMTAVVDTLTTFLGRNET